MKKIKMIGLLALFAISGVVSAHMLTPSQCHALDATINLYFEAGLYSLADSVYEVYESGGCWHVDY